LSVGSQAIRGGPDAAPREPQVPVPEKANFVVCDQTIYHWFRRLADGGWLERLHYALLLAVREHQGREASPTARDRG
jgi:hypothetical protein